MTEPPDTASTVWNLIATVVFVALNGFFVAAEFALVKVRPSHVGKLAQQGHRRAALVRTMLQRLDLYLSACQLGITLASLILGWLAEPAIAALIIQGAELVGWQVADNAWLHPVALGIALTVVTVAHMTVGEQAPKVWSIRRPEVVVLLVAWPLRIFTFVFKPLIWSVNKISNGMLLLVGVPPVADHEGVYDLDELRAILSASAKFGHLTTRQRMFGENILALAGLEVRHVMVPRIDIAFLSSEKTPQANLEIVRDTGHSRFPLGAPDLDSVRGLVHTRDILREMLADHTPVIEDLPRDCLTVPDTQPLSRFILDLQKSQTQSALVVDEHGTMVGMAFLEDALEEIVGPIHDEFDERVTLVETVSPDVVELAGSVPLPEAAQQLGVDLDDEADTIGGYVVAHLGRLPYEGDKVELGPFTATVLGMSRRRVVRLRFERTPDAAAHDGV